MRDENLIADLVLAGLSPELIGRVANAIIEAASTGTSTGLPVDKTAEKRRAFDRDRKAKEREIHRTSTGLPPDSADAPIYIDSLDTKKVRKKDIAPLLDVPVEMSEEDRAFSESKGWGSRKTSTEWQRFRDHSIVKGKKHKGERGLRAAWRNWVTSPFQTPEGVSHEKPSLVEQSGFYAAFSSPEMISWSNHERIIGKSYPRDKAGGWRFPSQWPPGLDPPRVENREGARA